MPVIDRCCIIRYNTQRFPKNEGKNIVGTGDFAITQEKNQEGVKLVIQGRMDSNNSVEFERKLAIVLEDGPVDVVLNMSQVEYLCSTGIRVILKAYKNAKAAGYKFGIEAASDCVRNVLGMVALDEMLIK